MPTFTQLMNGNREWSTETLEHNPEYLSELAQRQKTRFLVDRLF